MFRYADGDFSLFPSTIKLPKFNQVKFCLQLYDPILSSLYCKAKVTYFHSKAFPESKTDATLDEKQIKKFEGTKIDIKSG